MLHVARIKLCCYSFVLIAIFVIGLPETIQAQQITSGGGDWQTLHTPHFQIHHRSRNRAYALQIGRMAEKVHARLEPYYKSKVETTHVSLIFDTDTVNAFATTVGFDQIVLFLEPPRLGEFARFDSWVELLFVHEYTHVLSLRFYQGRGSEPLYYLLGIPPNHLAPFGVIEGTAVREESAGGKGRLRDPLTLMVVRTAILTDTYPSLGEVMTGSHRWPGGRIGYLYGGRYIDEMATAAGEESIPRFWNSKALPMALNRRMPYQSRARKTYDNMRKKDADKFNKQIQELRGQGLTEYERLTEDGGTKTFLTLNDQGELLYFARPFASLPGLFRVNLEDGEIEHDRRQLSSNGIAEAASTRIYSEDYMLFPGFGLRYELYDGDSFFLDRMAPDRSISFPTLSARGEQVAFIEHDETTRYLKIARVVDSSLVDERILHTVQYNGLLQYATLAPGGDRVAAVIRPGSQGYAALSLCPTNPGGSCRPILYADGIITQVRFTPDGRSLVFASDADGIYNIYQYNLDTGKTLRLTRTLTGLFYPAPAANGDLYAMRYFQNGYDVIRIQSGNRLSVPAPFFKTIGSWDELLAENRRPGDEEQGEPEIKPGDPLPEGWRESSYWGMLEMKPYLMGLVGYLSTFNLGVLARDPLLRHQFLVGVGSNVPDPIAVAYYDYSRFKLGFSAQFLTNYWKRDRNHGCLNEDSNPYRFLCDDSYSFQEEARAYLRYTDTGRYFSEQIMLGYVHRKLRNARRIRLVEYDARDFNLSGPSLSLLFGDTHYYSESVSPEHGWRFILSSDYYTKPESTDRVHETDYNLIEYGVAEGGLALYLPSFWDNHVNYLSGYGYGSYGPDRAVQKIRLNRFVRGLDYIKAPSNHTAFVGTYEYRFPLLWHSGGLESNPGVMLRDIGVSLFADYGAVYDRKVYRENYVLDYGMSLSFGLNLAYLRMPALKLTWARGTGPAGEGQVYLSFNAELGSTGYGHPHNNRNGNDVFREPYRRSMPGFDNQPGYFRDRKAGGILE